MSSTDRSFDILDFAQKSPKISAKSMSNEGGKQVDYFYNTKDEREQTLAELRSGKKRDINYE